MVDDINSMGMGFRSYHAHVIETLSIRRRGGADFQNTKGETLSLTALQQDDLWGFLGKQHKSAKGPGRKISPSKFAVLDAYFKCKSPELAKSFSSSNLSPHIASILKSFFSFEKGPLALATSRAKRLEGIYVAPIDRSDAEMKLAIDTGLRIRLNAVFIRFDEATDHVIVHYIQLPVTSGDLATHLQDSILAKYLDEYREEEYTMFSGVGLIHDSAEWSNIEVSCMLRDRITCAPYMQQFSWSAPHSKWDDDRWSNDQSLDIGRPGSNLSTINNSAPKMMYCGTSSTMDNLTGLSNLGYNQRQWFRLLELYENLGVDV